MCPPVGRAYGAAQPDRSAPGGGHVVRYRGPLTWHVACAGRTRPTRRLTLRPADQHPTPTPLPCCGSLAVATFITGCEYDPGNYWTNISYQADVINSCTRSVTADVTFYLQVTADDPPTTNWVC